MEYHTLLVHMKLGATNDAVLQIAGNLAEQFSAYVIGLATCEAVSDTCLALLPEYPGLAFCDAIADSDRQRLEEMVADAERRFRMVLQGVLRTHNGSMTSRPDLAAT